MLIPLDRQNGAAKSKLLVCEVVGAETGSPHGQRFLEGAAFLKNAIDGADVRGRRQKKENSGGSYGLGDLPLKVPRAANIVVVDPDVRFGTEALIDCRLPAIQEAVDPSAVVPVSVTNEDVELITRDIGHMEISKFSDNSNRNAFSGVN